MANDCLWRIPRKFYGSQSQKKCRSKYWISKYLGVTYLNIVSYKLMANKFEYYPRSFERGDYRSNRGGTGFLAPNWYLSEIVLQVLVYTPTPALNVEHTNVIQVKLVHTSLNWFNFTGEYAFRGRGQNAGAITLTLEILWTQYNNGFGTLMPWIWWNLLQLPT